MNEVNSFLKENSALVDKKTFNRPLILLLTRSST